MTVKLGRRLGIKDTMLGILESHDQPKTHTDKPYALNVSVADTNQASPILNIRRRMYRIGNMSQLTTSFIDWIQRSNWTPKQLDALNAALDALEDIEAGRYRVNDDTPNVDNGA